MRRLSRALAPAGAVASKTILQSLPLLQEFNSGPYFGCRNSLLDSGRLKRSSHRVPPRRASNTAMRCIYSFMEGDNERNGLFYL
ncbi:MAG: hypothetical protein WDN30_03890 [Pararobbsia sp.]